jgi:hypothetical protein
MNPTTPPTMTKTTQTYTYYGRSGYIGTSPQPQPISVEVSRYPHQLTGSYHIIGEDANPAEIIYEVLTNDPLGLNGSGLGLSTSMIDIAAFNTAAAALYAESFGISFSWDQPTSVEELVQELCKLIDATCYRDFRTGLYTIKLIRGGYVVSSLPVLNEDNCVIDDYTQGSIEGTVNEVQITYTNREREYKKSVVIAQDLANMRLQTSSDINSQNVSFLQICVQSLADRIANRELLVGSTPLVIVELVTNRENYAYGPGDLFVLNWVDLGITNLVLRVSKASIGGPTDNKIKLTLVQDLFYLNSVAYTSGNDTNWTNPIVAPVIVVNQKMVELPYGLNPDRNYGNFTILAQAPNSGCINYEVFDYINGEPAVYASMGVCTEYTPSSTIVTNFPIGQSIDNTGILEVVGSTDLMRIKEYSEDQMRQGFGLMYFATTGEWCSYTAIEYQVGTGNYKIYGVWRGLLDTVPVAHTAGERIYFVSEGSFYPESTFLPTATVYCKLCPSGPLGAVTLTSVPPPTAMSLTMTGRNQKPNPPGRLLINRYMYPSYIQGPVDFTWEHRNCLTDTGSIIRQDDLGNATPEGTYEWRLLVNGVSKETASGLTGKTWSRGGQYTAAQRIEDSANGNYLVEIQVRQTNTSGSSAYNTSGAFQMVGFGMCFGQRFGGA